MSYLDQLNKALDSTDLSEAQKATINFAVGMLATIDEPIIAAAEKKTGIEYRKIAREFLKSIQDLN